MRYKFNKLANAILGFAGTCFVFGGLFDIFLVPAFFALIAGFISKWIAIAMDTENWPPSPLAHM